MVVPPGPPPPDLWSPIVSSPVDDLLKRAAARLRGRIKRALQGAPSGPPIVTFEGREPKEVPPGTTLLAAASLVGLDLNHYCGGTCSCGTCRVEILEGFGALSKQEGREKMVLGGVHVEAGHRLACQARVQGPVKVRIPAWF